jgi:phytoene synthase
MFANPQSLIPNPDLDRDVRRFDEDRWLASRFAPPHLRARLIAIYALNHEIARTAEVVSTPQLADLRLAWWREAIDEIHSGAAPREHPTLAAYARACAGLSASPWVEIIEARRPMEGRFNSWDAADAFIERTARAVMSLAVQATGTPQDVERFAPALTDAALAWGYVALARSSLFPAIAPGPAEEALSRARAAHERMAGVRPPAQLFPALGYVALVPGYIRALAAGRSERLLIARQLELIAAAATGRL